MYQISFIPSSASGQTAGLVRQFGYGEQGWYEHGVQGSVVYGLTFFWINAQEWCHWITMRLVLFRVFRGASTLTFIVAALIYIPKNRA
jgi:hypothetical protein